MKKIISLLLILAFVLGMCIVSFATVTKTLMAVDTYKAQGTYPTKTGSIFAGWFSDQACENAFHGVSGNAYAKFVDSKTLAAKFQLPDNVTSASSKVSVRLITSVDSVKYSKVGFKVTVNGVTQTLESKQVYASIKGGGNTYYPTVFSSDSSYFATFKLENIPKASYSSSISVTPFFVTFDGTTVTGTARSFKLSDYLEDPAPVQEDSDYVKFMKKKYPTYAESTVGLDITFKDDIVAVCYSTWHDFARNWNTMSNASSTLNIRQILANGGNGFGGTNIFHYWDEPALGYYSDTNSSVIRTHMTQLADAGVDFIILDNTNVSWGDVTTEINFPQMYFSNGESFYESYTTKPTKALLDTCKQMRSEGLKTPYIVFWCRNVYSWSLMNNLYTNFVKNYPDLFVYLRNDVTGTANPLFLGTGLCDSGSGTDISSQITDTSSSIYKLFGKKITYRTMWGLQEGVTNKWSYLNRDTNNPRIPVTDSSTGKTYYEQISVSVAAQRTYMSTTSTAKGRRGGLTFYENWLNAFNYRPKIVVVTWWNEWVAQNQGSGGSSAKFVDLWTSEYSRDIEPMKGGHGDQYYRWMQQYITAYKGHQTCPRLVEAGR